ncbi:ESX-1 secretion-associated protein EspI isoform X2 [Calliphora vicina]|uniref:ESX-1 secretion-associated protein EspI isoform X2 n=1 Tax=Calliphora vicina TaxID=7373 RepID=UPI00325BA77D
MDQGLPAGAIVSIVIGALIATAMVVFWIVLIIWCCLKRKNVHNQTTVSQPTPVVVTSATHTAPGGYPVTQMPVGATTTAYQTQVYATPYPPQGAPTHMPMPMPMAGGQPPAGVQPPYPPYPTMSAASMNPPSYDVAVSGAGAGQPNNAASYQKQAPYNPSYQM